MSTDATTPPTEGNILDPEVRAGSPSFYVNAASLAEVQQLAVYQGSQVMTAERKWLGENVSGWKNADQWPTVRLWLAESDSLTGR